MISGLLSLPVIAEGLSEQEYKNQLAYRRSRLNLVSKKRLVDVKRSYSHTDIDTTTYTWEAYSLSNTDITTSSMNRAEAREIMEWYIYKGGLRELSDIEFLELVNDRDILEQVKDWEAQKANMRNIGNTSIGLGFLVMVGGAALSGGQTTITGGAVLMACGFMVSALNTSPSHYIQPDYAQEKIDDYNITLKKELGLPLDFE